MVGKFGEFGKLSVICQTKTIQTFPLNYIQSSCVTHLVYYTYSLLQWLCYIRKLVVVQRLVSTIRCLWGGRSISKMAQIQMYGSYKLMNRLLKADQLLAQFIVTDTYCQAYCIKTRQRTKIYYFIVAHKMKQHSTEQYFFG